MSPKADMARLEFALKMIADIELIVERHGGITLALSDFEGFPAIMMCCFQIGEAISKIKSPEILKRLPTKEAKGLRNVIGHNYLGIRPDIIKQTINDDMVSLKKDIISILSDYEREFLCTTPREKN